MFLTMQAQPIAPDMSPLTVAYNVVIIAVGAFAVGAFAVAWRIAISAAIAALPDTEGDQ